MSDESANDNSLTTGAGCLLIPMGLIPAAVGITALLGVSDRIEFEFFGIELNDRTGQLQWVAGSIVAVIVGVLLLRTRRAA